MAESIIIIVQRKINVQQLQLVEIFSGGNTKRYWKRCNGKLMNITIYISNAVVL